MSPWWIIPATGVVLALALAAWLNRRRIVRDWDSVVTFTKGRVMTRDALQGSMLVALALFILWSVDRLNTERDARLDAELRQVVTQDRLDAVERSTRAYARFLSPSDEDVLEIYRRYREACARRTPAGAQCRRDFAASINQVLRIVNNRIVPAPGARTAPRGDDGAVTVPRPAPPPRTVTVPGPPGKPGERGPMGPQGPPGRNVDSALVDGLDNRITDVERALANVLGRLPVIDRVLALLCRPPLRICG